MKRDYSYRQHMRPFSLGLVVCLCSGLGFAQGKGDIQRLEALGKGLEALGRSMAAEEQRNAARQRMQEERERQQQAQERAAEAAAAAQRQRQTAIARENWRQTITPPVEYAGRISIHRQVFLENTKNPQSPPPDFELPSSTTNISPQGRWHAYIDQSGALKLRDPATKDEKTLRTGLKDIDFIFFVDEESLIFGSLNFFEFIDLQGNTLQKFSGLALPVTSSSGRYVLHTKNRHDTEKHKWFCDGAALYTAKGQLIDNVDAANSENCATRITDDGRLEVLTLKDASLFSGETITVHRAGTKIASFEGDNRPIDKNKGGGKYAAWLGKSSYAVTYAGHSSSPRLWDISQGKMLCDLSSISPNSINDNPYGIRGMFLEDGFGGFYVNYPAQRLTLPGCQLQRLGAANERLTIRGNLAYLHETQTGRVDIIDIASWKIRHSVQTDFTLSNGLDSKFSDLWQQSPANPNLLLGMAYVYSGVDLDQIPRSVLVNLDSGQVRRDLPRFNDVQGGYLRSYERGKYSRFWKITFQEDPPTEKFIASLQKDKFESTAEYRARLAGLTLPYRLNVSLHDYDADAGAFSGSWNGAPVHVPLAPADARLFAQARNIEVQGDLALLDGDFLELRNPSVTAPDGRRIALKVATGPAPTVKPVSNAPAAMGGGVLLQSVTATTQLTNPANAAHSVGASAIDLGSDCKAAETRGMAQIEEIRQRVLANKPGACEAARLNRKVGEIGLSVYTVCKSREGIDAMNQMIRETDATIRGVCG
ncbi:MAG: hypothetical protein LC097_00885 [Burkholderiales bacterium]|nr:hypothetical protein [Burkholderiales bacterium]